jgi:hypothetical protein
MAAGAQGRPLVWDWERSATDVPLGLDALHLELQTSVLRGIPAQEAIRKLVVAAPAALAPFSVDDRLSQDVVLLYGTEMLTRWTEDGQWVIPWAEALMHELLATLRRGTPQ